MTDIDGRGKQYRGNSPVPTNAHPLVRTFFTLMNQARATPEEVSQKAGMTRTCLTGWKRGHSPNLGSIEAALNALGYTLAIVRVGPATTPANGNATYQPVIPKLTSELST